MTDPEIKRLVDKAASLFQERFGLAATYAGIAPGRVEVLGNHTDYNGGYTLSAALEKRTVVVGAFNGTSDVTVSVLDDGRKISQKISFISHQSDEPWANYPFGVIDQILKIPNVPALLGLTLGIIGEVPIGSGLSSSAALEVATALTVLGLIHFDIEKMELAQLCQRAENQFVGLQSGLMDQFSSVFGEEDSFLFLDSRTLEHGEKKSSTPFELVICDSMVKHVLTGSEYNTRRAECESAAKALGAKQLRDLTVSQVEAGKSKLTENEYKRALHITSENARVLDAVTAIAAGDLDALGILMNQSHESSKTLFENSTVELDQLAALAQSLPGCYGARLTGGGFGGAIISLVKTDCAQEFGSELTKRYGSIIGQTPNLIISRVGNGAMRVKL